jgi:hypothetical protein
MRIKKKTVVRFSTKGGNFIFDNSSRPVPGLTQPLILRAPRALPFGMKWLESEAPSDAGVKKA